jgi:hypothetical protein
VRDSTRAAAAAGILLLAGCQTRFERFAFQVDGIDGARRPIELRETPGVRPDREGRLDPAQNRRETPLYRLARPVSVGGDDLAFVIGYASDVDAATLTLLEDRGRPLLEAVLPATGGQAIRYQAALPAGSRIWGFRIAAGPGTGSLSLRSAGLEPLVHGFRIDADLLTTDGSIAVSAPPGAPAAARLSAGLRDEMRTGRWQLALELPDGGSVIRLAGPDGSSASFSVAADGPRQVCFQEGCVGFLPRDLRVSAGSAAGPAVLSCRVSFVPEEAPIPSDPGLILGWRRSAWRDPEAELFAWTRLPDVLIFDTASYEVQERYFRRLAFFVEKPGTAGTIPSLDEVTGRRSWNAHDYRAEDLARFFSLAAGSPLTPEERRLRDVLIANGIIRADGAGYAAGAGAVLSISRESSASLRELLVTHEAFHGVFFALPADRAACRAAWEALDRDEQAVWLAYFDLKGYNTADRYLVVNEFQSYLFQQERREVGAFQQTVLQRVRDTYPALGPTVRRLEAARPDSFLNAFDSLERALTAAGGPRDRAAFPPARTCSILISCLSIFEPFA